MYCNLIKSVFLFTFVCCCFCCNRIQYFRQCFLSDSFMKCQHVINQCNDLNILVVVIPKNIDLYCLKSSNVSRKNRIKWRVFLLSRNPSHIKVQCFLYVSLDLAMAILCFSSRGIGTREIWQILWHVVSRGYYVHSVSPSLSFCYTLLDLYQCMIFKQWECRILL